MPATRRTPRASKPPARTVTPADFERVFTWLDTSVLIERAGELRVIKRGTLAGVNVHQLGPPGTAKSLGLREFGKCIVGANYFEKQLHANLPADAVIGAYDMAKFAATGLFERKTEGYAPWAHIIFLDEWFRANGPMLDSLLPLANTEERQYEHNGGVGKANALVLVSASNHMPDPDNEQAQALVDRITLMSFVEPVKSDDGFKDMVRRHHDRRIAEAEGTWARETITLEQLIQAQREVNQVRPSPEYLDKATELRHKARDAGLGISDRRWMELGRVARAQAWLADRDFLIPEDLAACEDGMWRDKDDIPTAHQLVLEFYGRFEREATKFRKEAAKPLAMMEEVRPLVEGVPPTEELPPDVLTKAVSASRQVAVCKGRVDSVLAEAEKEKRDATTLRELSNELLAIQLWLKKNKLPHGMD